MNGLLRKSRIKLAELIIILSLLNQALSLNSNITKSDNKLIIDLEYNDKQIFYATLLIGSNHQKINFIFSTLSELSMITSDECNDCVSGKNNTNSNNYEYKKSANFQNISGSMKIDNAYEGTFAKDSISYKQELDRSGNFSNHDLFSQNFNFFLINNVSDQTKKLNSQGIIGLGLEKVSNIKHSNYNFISNLQSEGLLASSRFSFYFSKNSNVNNTLSKLYIGDFSQGTLIGNLYSHMNYCKVGDNTKGWACDLNRIEFIGYSKATITSISKIIFDTSSPNIVIPLIDYKMFKKSLFEISRKECIKTPENSQLVCKCDTPDDFPNLKLTISNNPFEILAKDLIEFSPYADYQCRFKIIVDLEIEDTWRLGTAVMKDSLFSFDIAKRKVGYFQHPLNFENFLNKENIIIRETEEDPNKVSFIFTLVFLIVLMFGLFKCANNENFFQNGFGFSEKRNSFSADDIDDKKKIELIKNRFNTEEYDYDEMREMKEVNLQMNRTAEQKDIKSNEK